MLNVYLSSLATMIKSRRMRWAGQVAHMRQNKTHIGFWWKPQKERAQEEDQDVERRIMLKLVLEKEDGVVWTGFFWFTETNR
jgi:hypothetical protein